MPKKNPSDFKNSWPKPMKPGGQNKKSYGGVVLNPPEGVAGTFKTPEMKNGQRFDFSHFFKLETCKNLYKILLVKFYSMIDLVFFRALDL